MLHGYRFEITGGNWHRANLHDIIEAIQKSGGNNVRTRRAYGMQNQPRVVTFSAQSESVARSICRKAEAILWPGDGSCMATLLAFPYK